MSKYLVCFKANYAYNDHNFDRVVEWDGTDVPSLNSKLRDIIRDDYCNGKKIEVGITLVSVFKLDNTDTQFVLLEEIIKLGSSPRIIIHKISTERDCRKTMCVIHNSRPFTYLWEEVNSNTEWEYIDEEDHSNHSFSLLEYNGEVL